jgi:ankyrin repeat protein
MGPAQQWARDSPPLCILRSHACIALVEAGANVTVRSEGVSALGVAAAKGHIQVVEALVRYGTVGTYTDFNVYYGHTALMIAAAEGHKDIEQMLLDQSMISQLH